MYDILKIFTQDFQSILLLITIVFSIFLYITTHLNKSRLISFFAVTGDILLSLLISSCIYYYVESVASISLQTEQTIFVITYCVSLLFSITLNIMYFLSREVDKKDSLLKYNEIKNN